MAKSKGRRLAEWLRNLDSNSKASSDTLADDSVSTAKLQTDSVTNPKIADGAVHTANLADQNVTFAKLHTAVTVTSSTGISASNDNDTTLPTTAALIDYVGAQIQTKDNSDEITEGTTNLYFTNERVDNRVNSLLTAGTGITLTYDDTANTLTVAGAAQYGDSDVSAHLNTSTASSGEYLSWNGSDFDWATIPAGYTDSDARSALSVTQNSAGTAALTYNSSTGVFTYTPPNLSSYLTSYTETDTLDSVTGRGNSTSNSITVGNATITGNLTVQGTTTTLDTATLNVEDKNITINYSTGDSSGSANGAGITIQDAVNSTTDATILWDTTNDEFDFSHAINVTGTVTATGGNSTNWNTAYGWGNHASAGYLTSFDITTQTDSKYVRSDVDDNKVGYLLFAETGTATSTVNYPSHPIIMRSSGWDTNNVVARTVDWYIRAETISSVYPDGDLVFYEESPSFAHEKMRLHGRGSGISYQDPDAATFKGNVNILQTSDSSGGNLTVTGTVTATGGNSTNWNTAYSWGNHASAGYLTSFDITTQTDPKYLRSDANDTGTNITLSSLILGDATLSHSTSHTWKTLTIQNAGDNNEASIHGLDSTGTQQFLIYGGSGSQGFLSSAYAWRFKVPVSGSLNRDNAYTLWDSGNDGSGSGLDADTVDGYNTATSATANTVVVREGSGHIYGNYILGSYFNSSAGNSENPTIGQIWTQNTSDNYLRKSTPAHLISQLGLFTASSRDIVLSSGAGGSYGNRLLIGATSAAQTLQDSNLRPTAYLSGAYPVLTLNHTSTTNDNHGPTIQFTHNGYNSNRQWVIGTDGQGQRLDFGVSGGTAGTNSNLNPHNGISGFTGVTIMRLFENGVLIGSTGTYPNEVTSVSNALDVRGNIVASGTVTINGSTAWHAGNDGSGSGLDADTLDGSGWLDYGRDIHANQVIADDWLRTTGATGWYNNTYGGGWYMTDTTWIRSYNSKSIFQNTGILRTDGTLQVGGSGATLNAPNGGTVTINGSTAWHAGNDGSGSGLDADTLDGVQGASFLRSDASDSFTGQLTMSTQKALIASDYGHGVYGVYSASKYQHVWSMGTAYNAPANGASTGNVGNLYGLAWTYNPNYGGAGNNAQAKDGLNHQLLLCMNGITYTALGNGIWTSGSISRNGNTVWDAGNDGSGSGLDADTVDGIHGSSLMRLDTTQTVPDGVRHIYECYGNIATTAGSQSSLEVFNNGVGTDAFLTFHVGADYAAYFGLDGGINDLAYGGWSVGAASYKVWHAANDGSGSGLDADTLDGYQGSNYIGLNGNSYFQLTTWLQSTGGHGFYSPSSGAGTHFYPSGLGDYGSFSCEGRKGGWGGYSIEGRVLFMHNGGTASGIYNDVNNHWLFYAVNGDKTAMYHNGSEKIYTYASGGRVTGDWLATGDVYAYYSDERLKDKTGKVENAIEKVKEIETFYYTHNEKAIELGYKGTEQQIGVSAQSVEKVLPEVVHLAPIDDDGEGNSVSGEEYKTVNYGRLVPLLIEAIKEQQAQIEELKEKLK
jgi:hypothetical protein